MFLRAQGGAFERINSDVDLRPVQPPPPRQHGCLVALAFSDHDRAVDGKLV
jgi:hypothetical protein